MHISKLKKSKYLGQGDLERPVLATIKNIKDENLALESELPEIEPVMSFEEDIKPLVLKWTNAQLCAGVCGSEETNDWPGKQIVLFADPTVAYKGKVTGGIRIRAPKPQGQPAQSPGITAPTAPPYDDDLDIPF